MSISETEVEKWNVEDLTWGESDLHADEHIDVALEDSTGGRTVLRFGIVGGVVGDIARFRHCIEYNGVSLDVQPEAIVAAGLAISEADNDVRVMVSNDWTQNTKSKFVSSVFD